jgi:hypothetical protein
VHFKVTAAHLKLKVAVPGFPITVFKTIGPAHSLMGLNEVGKKGKIVSLGYQGITVNPLMSVFIQIRQDLPVAPEKCMHVPYIVILVAVDTVIVVVTALIGTEFLIRPPMEPGSAVKTYSFHSKIFL